LTGRQSVWSSRVITATAGSSKLGVIDWPALQSRRIDWHQFDFSQ
jgi:hypothetical protein